MQSEILYKSLNYNKIQGIVQKFHAESGLPCMVFDRETQVIASSMSNSFCINYHNEHSDTMLAHILSNLRPTPETNGGLSLSLFKCENGLWNAVAPVFYENEIYYYIVVCGFHIEGEETEKSFFRRRAKSLGLKEAEFLEMIDGAPVITRERLASIDEFIRVMMQLLKNSINEFFVQQEKEKKRIESEKKRIEKALNAVGDAAWEYDTESKDLFLSEKFYEITLYDPLSIESNIDFWLSKVHPDDTTQFIEKYRAFAENPFGILSSEFRMLNAEGEWIWLEVKGNQTDSDSPGLRLIGIASDITFRKEAELRIIELQEEQQQFIDLLPEMVYEIDLEGNMLLTNQRALEVFGVSKNDFDKGVNVFDFISNECKKDAATNMQKVAQKGGIHSREYVGRKLDGTLFPVRIVSSPVIKNGATVGFRGTLVDLTEIKKNERKLIESESKYRSIFENAYEAVLVVFEGSFVDCNKKALELFGYSRTVLLEKNFISLSASASPDGKSISEALRQHVENTIAFGSTSFDWLFVRRDGVRFEAEVSFSRVVENQNEFIFTVIRDVTEKRKQDQEILDSQKTLQILFDKTGDGNLLIKDSLIIECSDQAAELLKYDSKADIIGKTPAELAPTKQPDGMPSVAKMLLMLDKTAREGNARFEWTIQLSTGEKSPIEVNLTLIRIKGENLIHAAWYNIKERKIAEQALRDNEEFLSLLLDTTPNCIYTVDSDRIIVQSNQAFKDAFSNAGQSPIGMNEDSFLGEHLADGNPEEFAKSADSMAETVFRLSNGELHWFKTIRKTLNSQSGHSWQYILMIDTSEERSALEALRVSQERFMMLAEKSPVSIISFDKYGIIQFINDYHIEKFSRGVVGKEFYMGKRITDIKSNLYSGINENLLDILKGETIDLKNVFVPEFMGGDPGWVNVRGVPVLRNGEVAGGIMIQEDITELKKAEEALKKNENKLKLRLDSIMSPGEDPEDFGLLDLVDINTLQQIQDNFALSSAVASVITDINGVPLTTPSNFSSVCLKVRTTEKGRSQCFKSDKYIGETAIATGRPVASPCLSCGFLDGGVPIIVAGRPVAIWMIGQTNAQVTNIDQIRKYAREIGYPEDDLAESYEEITFNMSEEQFNNVLGLLDIMSKEIALMGYNNLKLARTNASLRRAEETLQLSNDNLSVTLDSIGDAVIVTDADGKVTRMNPIAEALTEYSRDEAAGRPLLEVFQIFNALTGAPATNPVENVIQTGQIVGLANHTELVSKTGKRYQIADSAAPIKSNLGAVLGVVMVFRDVSKQYKQESLLRKSEQRLLLAQAVAHVGNIEIDFTNRVVSASDEAYRIGGFEKTGNTIPFDELLSFIPDSEMATFENNLLLQKSGDVDFHMGIRKKSDNSPRILRVVGILTDDETGHRFVGTIQDVTEKRSAEVALVESQRMLSTLMANLPGVAYRSRIDENRTMEFVSSGCIPVSGYSPADLTLGMTINWADIIHPEDRKNVLDVINHSASDFSTLKLFYRIITAQNEEKWIWEQGQVVSDSSGAPAAIEGFMTDITERLRTEEALRANEEKYRSIFELSPESILLVDPDGYILEHNDKIREWLQYEEEFVGSNVLDLPFVDKPNLIKMRQIFAQRNEGHTIPHYEIGFKAKNGKTISGWVMGTPIRDDDGNIIRYLFMVSDITDRRKSMLLQEIVYEIATATNTSEDLDELSAAIQSNLSKIIDTRNFFIAFYEKETDTITLPFYADEEDPDRTFPAGKTLTSYVIKNDISARLTQNDIEQLKTEGKVESFGVPAKVWLGVPLKIRDNVIGAVVVQNYESEDALSENDLKILGYISEQIAIALERKRIEQLLRQSELQYRTLTERLPVAVYRSTRDGRIIYVNPSFARILGYSSPEEVYKMSPGDIIVGERDTDKLLEAWRYSPAGIVSQELQLRTKTGHIIWVRDTFTIVLNDDGDIDYFDGVNEDITEAKMATEALRESERNLAEAQRIAHVGSWNLSLINQQLVWSDEIYRIYGLTKFDFPDCQQAFWKLLHKKDVALVRDAISRAIETKEPYTLDYRINRKDGSIRHVHFQGEIITDKDGAPISINGTMQDITERKQAEEQIRRLNNELEQRVIERTMQLENALEELKYENEERKRTQEELYEAKENIALALEKEKELGELKTRFMSMISHEYRTPLTVILNSTYIIEKLYEGSRREDFNDFLDKIRVAIKGMTSLLEEVLLIGKSEAGKLTLVQSELDVVGLWKRIIDEIKMADKEGHQIEFSSNADSCIARADEKLLRQVMTNLLSNAVKYSDKGTNIKVSFLTRKSEYSFTVKDEGIGIAAEDKKMLFEPFHRGKNISTKQGTGLGLSIVKRCLDALGGDIKVKSQLGEGTTFAVKIPKN